MPQSSVILKCSACGTSNRIPPGVGVRCGKCKRHFTHLELQRGALGADRVPPDPVVGFDVDEDEDVDLEDEFDGEQDREEE